MDKRDVLPDVLAAEVWPRALVGVALLVTVLRIAALAEAQEPARPATSGQARVRELALDNSVKHVSGNWWWDPADSTVHGKLFRGSGYSPELNGFATFNVRGYDRFIAAAGIMDGRDSEATMTVEVDGEVAWQERLKPGDLPKGIDVSLTGHDTLCVRAVYQRGAGSAARYFEPRVVRGSSGDGGTRQPISASSGGEATRNVGASATFVVDPNDLDKLATNLRRRMDAAPTLLERLSTGQVGVMTFDLVDIGSASVATNVAEDLSTAMINNGFHVVERAQLDKALKELKIQGSGLVDPESAKRIGQLTGCDTILLGSISDRGQFVVINARLIDTASGRSIVAERVEMRKIPLAH